MKKKIVNLVLSAAVITSMMFAMTACGSKDEPAADTSASRTTVEDTATPASTAEAAKEDEKKEEESKGMSLQEWLDQGSNASDMDSVVKELSSDELAVSYKVDGDTFVLVYTFSDTVEIDDAGKASMESEFEAQSAVFENMRDALIEETDNQNIKIRMEYINGDGSELFTYEFE